MRTAAWETAPQIALRNCFREVGGGQGNKCDFGEGGLHALAFAKCFLLVTRS